MLEKPSRPPVLLVRCSPLFDLAPTRGATTFHSSKQDGQSTSPSIPSRALLAYLQDSLGYTFCVFPADRYTRRSMAVSARARGLPVAMPQCRGDSGWFH